MKNIALALATVTLVATASAQMTYVGVTQGANQLMNAALTTNLKSNTATISDPLTGILDVRMTGMQTVVPRRNVARYSLQTVSYYSFRIGGTRVRASTTVVTPTTFESMIGRASIAGGPVNPVNLPTAEVWVGANWYSFTDLNGDGLYQETEPSVPLFLAAGRSRAVTHVGIGFTDYNWASLPIVQQPHFNANSNYMLRVGADVEGLTFTVTGDPLNSVTTKYNGVQPGYRFEMGLEPW